MLRSTNNATESSPQRRRILLNILSCEEISEERKGVLVGAGLGDLCRSILTEVSYSVSQA